MRKFTWVVLTNCDVTHHEEFNKWYDERHLKDLLRIPGIVAARRLTLSGAQMIMDENSQLRVCGPEESGAKYQYLALYEFETDDPKRVLEEVRLRSGTDLMRLSPFLAEASTILYENRS